MIVIVLSEFGSSGSMFSFDGSFGSVFVDLVGRTAPFSAVIFFSSAAPVAFFASPFFPAVATDVVDFIDPAEGDLRNVGVFVPLAPFASDADGLRARAAALDGGPLVLDTALASDDLRGRLFPRAGATTLALLRTEAADAAEVLLARLAAVSRAAEPFFEDEEILDAALLELVAETLDNDEDGRTCEAAPGGRKFILPTGVPAFRRIVEACERTEATDPAADFGRWTFRALLWLTLFTLAASLTSFVREATVPRARGVRGCDATDDAKEVVDVLSALSSASSSAPDAFDIALGARCMLGVALREDDGANFESGLLSFRSRSEAVVSLEETRLVVDPATLRATLRIDAPEELSRPDPGGPR